MKRFESPVNSGSIWICTFSTVVTQPAGLMFYCIFSRSNLNNLFRVLTIIDGQFVLDTLHSIPCLGGSIDKATCPSYAYRSISLLPQNKHDQNHWNGKAQFCTQLQFDCCYTVSISFCSLILIRN